MKPVTVNLETPTDLALLRGAVEDRHEHLAKLSDKVLDGGRYSREATIIRRDAQRLKDAVLPRLTEQTVTELGEPAFADVLTLTIGQRVRQEVRFALRKQGAKTPGEAHELTDAFEQTVGSIAEIAAKALAPILADIAEEGFDAGRRSIDDAPDRIAARVVQSRAA